MSFVTMLIPLLTPILLALVKAVVPKVPKVVIPIAAPVVGALADIIAYYVGLNAVSDPLLGALLGMAGVAVREVVDQLKKVLAPA